MEKGTIETITIAGKDRRVIKKYGYKSKCLQFAAGISEELSSSSIFSILTLRGTNREQCSVHSMVSQVLVSSTVFKTNFVECYVVG